MGEQTKPEQTTTDSDPSVSSSQQDTQAARVADEAITKAMGDLYDDADANADTDGATSAPEPAESQPAAPAAEAEPKPDEQPATEATEATEDIKPVKASRKRKQSVTA